MGEYRSFILLLFLPLAQATCPTTLPTDAAFTMATQYHAGSYGNASSVHLLSLSNSAPSTYSTAYNLASGAFMKTPSNQCSQSCLTRLRAMGKPAKDGTMGSIIMMWDKADQSPPATNVLYSAYTSTVVPGEYLYCSNVAGTCGGSVPLYLYYNAETDDYQVRGDKDTVDDNGARLQNMGLPICWLFPALPTTSTSIGTITGSSMTTSSGSSTTTTMNPREMGSSTTTVSSTTTSPVTGSTSTTKGSSETVTSTTTTPYTGPPTTSTTADPAASTTTTTPYTGPPTTSTTADPAASTTTTTPYTGPATTSTTADPAGSTTTTIAGSGSTTTTVKPTTTTSPYVYDATTDISGTYGPGDQKLENGTVIRPNGDTIYPNGTVRTSDGTIIENGQKTDPDGTVHNPDGSTKYPNGTVSYPGDSNTGTGGGGKSGDDTPHWVVPAVVIGVMSIGIAALGMIFFGVTSMMKRAPPSSVNPYEVPKANEQWPNQRQPNPSADLPPAISEPVTTAQPQSFGATQTLQGNAAAPNSLYFG